MFKKFTVFSMLVILALVLSACSTAATSTTTTGSNTTARGTRQAFSGTRMAPQGTFQPPSGTMPAGFPVSQDSAATPTATATPKPTATSTPTATPVTASAEASAKAYFAALQGKDFTAASQLVSVYSLTYAEMVRSDVASQLTDLSQKGTDWSNFQVVGSQALDSSTILVHVTYRTGAAVTATAASSATLTPTAAQDTNQKDELWPFRLENGQWLYNWNNLIDYKTLDVSSQTSNHITILPTLLARYSDRIELHFMMQNQTSDVVYFVQAYDSLAVFHFGDQAIEADKSHSIVISGLHTSFDEYIAVKGLFTSYPDWVEVKKYKGYYPNPWYTFQF